MLIFIPTAIINSGNISPIPSNRDILISKILGRLWSFDHLLDIRRLHQTRLSLWFAFLRKEQLIPASSDLMQGVIGPRVLWYSISAVYFNSEYILPHFYSEVSHFSPGLSPTIPDNPIGGVSLRRPPNNGNIVAHLRRVGNDGFVNNPSRVVPKSRNIHFALDGPALVNLVHHLLDTGEFAVFAHGVHVVRVNRTAGSIRSARFADHFLGTRQAVI